MTIKFGDFANFIVRNFVVIWEADWFESLAFVGGHISLQNTEIVLTDPAFVVLRFESRDWRSFV